METYNAMRHFADSWGMLAMFLLFGGVVLYTFRPGSKAPQQDAANIPLRHGDVLEDDIAATSDSTKPEKEPLT